LWGLSMRTETRLDAESKPMVIGDYSQIHSICQTGDVDRIIVALDERRGKFPLEQLLFCRLKGIPVDDGVAFTEQLAGKLSVESLHPSFLIFSDGFKRSAIFKRLKRGVDIIGSLLSLTLLAPMMLIISLAIRLDSKGPVLYRQERVGEDDKIFNLLKFRSMNIDAEENGPVWAEVDDQRVTRVGRVIRKLRLDEIPQMFNVLKGEMSFVGPRPERPFFVDQLKNQIPFYSERHVIKPGITGWAQISYHYGASKEDALEKLKYDLYYVKHMSPVLDLMIVFNTVKIVLLGRGAR
jgi:sugar transferase (PEP-CTERM system associated)